MTESDEAAALKRLERESFDALLANLDLPGLHGLAVIRSARHLNGSLAILANSSEGTVCGRSCAEAVTDAGGDGFLAMPLQPEALAEALATAMLLRSVAALA